MSEDTQVVPATQPSHNLAIPEEIKSLLAVAAKESIQNESKGLQVISLKGKRFSAGDIKLGTELAVVVLADTYDNAWYDAPYKEDVINAPACFAIGTDEAMLAPHATSPKPQSEDCESCDKNAFGSSSNGKGKACRNGRRLLVAPFTDGDVDLANTALISLAPTSLKGYSKHKRVTASLYNLPVFAIGTRLSFDDDKAYPVLEFAYISNVTNSDTITKIMENRSAYQAAVQLPYNVEQYKDAGTPADNAGTKSKLS